MENKKSHFVYVIECTNGHYYTGYTTDVMRRYQEHVNGSDKCKYTRAFPPKQLLTTWEFETCSDALKFEHKIKSLSKSEKVALCKKRG